MLKLNVGGTHFTTSRSTLTKCGGFFSALIDSFDRGLKSDTDETGALFIDRDPEPFAHLLTYMRTGCVYTSDLSPGMAARHRTEFDFFAIPVPEALSAPEGPDPFVTHRDQDPNLVLLDDIIDKWWDIPSTHHVVYNGRCEVLLMTKRDAGPVNSVQFVVFERRGPPGHKEPVNANECEYVGELSVKSCAAHVVEFLKRRGKRVLSCWSSTSRNSLPFTVTKKLNVDEEFICIEWRG